MGDYILQCEDDDCEGIRVLNTNMDLDDGETVYKKTCPVCEEEKKFIVKREMSSDDTSKD